MRVSTIMMAMLLSGIVLGYELGILPVVIPTVHYVFQASVHSISLVTAVLPVAAAVAALVSGVCADWLGRRNILLIGALLILFGTLECAISESLVEFVFGRILIGGGVGTTAVMLPLYLVEVAPAQRRGTWVAIFFLSVNIGVFLSCIIGTIFSLLQGWRGVFMVAGVPGLLLFFVGLSLPESPRWLIMSGRQGQAGKALIQLFGTKSAMSIISAMDAVDHRIIYQPTKLLSHTGLRILFLGLLINIFAQAVGVHAVEGYAAIVLQNMHLNARYIDLFSNMVVSLLLMVAALLAIRFIDRLPRRKMLLIGMSGIVTSLVMMSWALHNIGKDEFMIVVVLMSCMFFVMAQGFSLGPIASLLPAEIFPQSIRGKGMGLSIAAYWITNTIIVYAFPRLLMDYGANLAFIIFLLFALLAWVWMYYNIPETSQVSLERLEMNLSQGLENRDLGMQGDLAELETA